jgi:hypothetical protein
MHTGQNSIAPEDSFPQLGQVRLGSVFMDLNVLLSRVKLRNEHGFPRQSAAARLGTQVPDSEPVAMTSSTVSFGTLLYHKPAIRSQIYRSRDPSRP